MGTDTNEIRLQKLIRFTLYALSKLHAVMLLALPAPMLYLFFSDRSDTAVCRLYLAAGVLIVCSIASDFAARRLSSFGAYIFCCLAAGLITMFIASALGDLLFSPLLKMGYLAATLIGMLIVISSAAQLRMREKRRQKALKENDPSWKEEPVLLENPSVFGLLSLASAYLLSVLTNCPSFCDLMLHACILYALILLICRSLQGTLAYFEEVRYLTNVPTGKILRQSLFFLSLLALLLILCALPARLTGGMRRYRDIRDWEADRAISSEEMYFPSSDSDDISVILHDAIEKGEYRPAPAWLIWLGNLLADLVTLLFCLMLIRLLIGYVHRFRGTAEEENGDIAVSLEADQSVRLRRPRSAFISGRNLTESEKIRREYRRAIRRYRRGSPLPSPCETPTRIEEGTAFPEGYDVAGLHEAYERARYGKGST